MTERTARRGPYAKTAARRTEILHAALASFAEHGYERASLRDIASRAGLTHAGLLHHFADKDELLTAALAQRDADQRERASNATAEGETSASTILTGLLANDLQQPDLVRSWLALSVAASSPDHPAHAFFAARHAEVRADFTGASTPAGAVLQLDPETKATMILAVFDGLQLQWLLNPTLDVLTPLSRFVELIWPPDSADAAASKHTAGPAGDDAGTSQ